MNILIVDDVKENLAIIEAACKKFGATECLKAATVAQALKLLSDSEKQRKRIDLIFLDINMESGNSGLDILRELLKWDYFTRSSIVILSARPDAVEVCKPYDGRIFEYLKKPMDYSQIKQCFDRFKSRYKTK